MLVFFISNPNVLSNYSTSSKWDTILKKITNTPELVTNITPNSKFNYCVSRKIQTSFASKKTRLNFIPIYKTTMIRFMEYISGKKILLQFYPFVDQNITVNWLVKYKLWLPRLGFYEKKLGHKFFMEESIHILHLSFFFRDTRLLLT
jgi:hypothetical protein